MRWTCFSNENYGAFKDKHGKLDQFKYLSNIYKVSLILKCQINCWSPFNSNNCVVLIHRCDSHRFGIKILSFSFYFLTLGSGHPIRLWYVTKNDLVFVYFEMIAVCKDSYVIYVCGFDQVGK